MAEVLVAPVREGDILAAKYRVDRVLGAGGMGVVVAATHLQLDQRVALKFLVSSVDEQACVRFLREARAVVKLRGEHVVRVLDTGTLEHGMPYIVMELLEGRDLAAELAARGPLGIVEAVDWVLQACEGIAEAHATGIVHRDLKPANLFLTHRADHSPLIKVLDFGIAKMLDLARAPDYSLTKTSALMGSPHYMSPEQIRNAKSVDRRADIWALGIVLYELLAGSAPFSATAAPALLAQIVADPPRPLRPLRPDVPRGLEALINRCLEKDPARRFADVAELSRELSQFASHEGRASSERVSRISLNPGFPKAKSELLLVTEPTLIAIEPKPRASQNPAPLVLSLAFGFCALGLAIWFGMHAQKPSFGAASALSSSTAASVGSTAIAANPIVTPIPGSITSSAPLVDASEAAPSSSVPSALTARGAAFSKALKSRAQGRVDRANALMPAKLGALMPATAAPPAAPAEAANPLDERK